MRCAYATLQLTRLSTMPYNIQLERIYTPAQKNDGACVLVDRLWPRGKRKEDLVLTEWYRDASPSNGLRRAWHNGDIDEAQFASDYLRELNENTENLQPLINYAHKGRLTLLTAARDPAHSHLPVLHMALVKALKSQNQQN